MRAIGGGLDGDASTTECIELLRTERVGRIGVVVRGHPEMFLVNYALDASDTVVLRTADGTKLAAAVTIMWFSRSTGSTRRCERVGASSCTASPIRQVRWLRESAC